MSVDGSYVVFASDRPVPGAVEPLRAEYGGAAQPGGNLWRSKMTRGWLPASVNQSPSTWSPSLALNGNLYFMSTDAKTGRFRLHVAPFDHSAYGPASNFTFSTGEFNDVDPMIDPKERFLIFSSDRSTPGRGLVAGTKRLFIAFEPRGSSPVVCTLAIPGWEEPTLSKLEARLSPDGRTMYFSSNHPVHKVGEGSLGPWDDGNAKIWMVPLRAQLWRHAAGANRACGQADIQATHSLEST